MAGVSVDLGAAAVLHRTPVEYPGSAIEKGIQGTVTVEVTLDASGDAGDVRVLSGPPELRRAVLQSVLEWHFLPDATGSVRQVSVSTRRRRRDRRPRSVPKQSPSIKGVTRSRRPMARVP